MRIRATIANGQSLSGAVDLGGPDFGHTLVGIQMPAAWTAASLTFQVSDAIGGTFLDLYAADGTEVTVQAAASRWVALAPQDFAGVRYLKVRSGTSAAAVNQGAARIVSLHTAKAV